MQRRRPSPWRTSAAPEDADQTSLAKDLDACRVDGKPLLWCHVANEGKRSVVTTVVLKRKGLKPGVPDVLVFTPPPAMPSARGCAIELKRSNGTAEDVDPAQVKWLAALSALGWVVGVAYGVDHARQLLRAAGYPIP